MERNEQRSAVARGVGTEEFMQHLEMFHGALRLIA